MNRASVRILLLAALAFLCVVSSGCGGSYNGSKGGPISVQLTQSPPQIITEGATASLVATVTNDKNNAGVTWSCSPASACGSFTPGTTGFQIDTVYTAPAVPLNVSSPPPLVAGQYAFALEGFASFGLVGSVTLDGNGNITGGEADGSANRFYTTVPSITGTYAVDSTGHGSITFVLTNTSCCGTFTETHGITVTSSTHAIIAEEDQFNGLTIGGIGSLDLQTAGPNFSALQVSGGYSFSLTGFSSAAVKASGGTGLNGSWAGIFSADGVGALKGGIFDASLAGGAPNFSSTPFTGSFSPPDSFGRGTMTFTGVDGGSDAIYAYYIVNPEVLRLTIADQNSANFAGNTGSAFGQGSVLTNNGSFSGSYVFSDFGFDAKGSAISTAGQLTSNGNGGVTTGIADLNDAGAASSLTLGGSAYTFNASPRGLMGIPAKGQTFNIYLVDPTLNLLDLTTTAPVSVTITATSVADSSKSASASVVVYKSGTGGALLLETDSTFDAIGIAMLQQGNAGSANLNGNYAMLLSDQNNPPNADGGFTASISAPSNSGPGTFIGEGDFQTQNTVNLVTGPVSGAFLADTNNPGRFTGTITTAPAFPNANIGDTTPGTENVTLYLVDSSQGFIVETDQIPSEPMFGWIELQDPLGIGAQAAHVSHADVALQEQAQPIKRVKGPQVRATTLSHTK